MEQITRVDGEFYYGRIHCLDVDDAYSRFRNELHRGVGRDTSKWLSHLLRRTERIHGFGFVFDSSQPAAVCVSKPVRYRIMGLVGISYFRVVGCWDYPDVDDDTFDAWFDKVFERGSGLLRLVGRKDKAGRTNRYNRRRHKESLIK